MSKPQRIQRKRTKGFNLQKVSRELNGLDCVYVGRPSKWGNPFKVGKEWIDEYGNKHKVRSIGEAVFLHARFRIFGYYFVDFKEKVRELKGKNLACWCPLDKPCHADILLKLANEN